MPRQKYKRKPEFWYAIQYNGTNHSEMTEFCYLCVYDEAEQKLSFNGVPVDSTYWIMHDNAEMFSMKTNDQFVAYFDLATGPP